MVAVRILGIDPGTVVVGFACVEVVSRPRGGSGDVPGGRGPTPIAARAANLVRVRPAAVGPVRLLEAGAVRLGSDRSPIGARLARLWTFLDEWFERLAPDEVALEEAFAGKSVQSALRIGEARGVVLAHAHRRGRVVHQYPPARIKRSVAGHGAASKDAVAALALKQLGLASLAGPRDASDAVAVALCHLEERRRSGLGDGRG